MNREELKVMARVCKKYFLFDMKQSDIAREENISKSTVSRLISRAKELGYINISLEFPEFKASSIEDELLETFNLKHVHIAAAETDWKILMLNIADAFSDYLNSIVSDGDIIGLSWGDTMTYLADHLKAAPRNDVKVVQLNGGIANRNISTRSDRIINQFADNFDAMSYILNAPSFVDKPEIAEALLQDTNIKNVIELAKEANTAIFSIGYLNPESVLIKAGYFTTEEYDALRQEGYVGDICSRYFKADGSHQNDDLYNRVIGIDLEEIKKKENSICVAIGEEKAQGILGAINGEYINTLFTDEKTAREVLRLHQSN
jgi:deoxyribonucleoside regulator